jgi:hypothetical protein
VPVEHLEYVDRALGLVEDAREQGLELRILGSLAYRLHCPANIELFEQMKRDLTDIDLAARSDQRRDARTWLEARGFVVDQDVVVATEGKRYCFTDPGSGTALDIFFDELYFCHPIPLRDRLTLDYPTITPTDLLLEKMQIVELNPKDVKDSLVLLLERSERTGGSTTRSRPIWKGCAGTWATASSTPARRKSSRNGSRHSREPSKRSPRPANGG